MSNLYEVLDIETVLQCPVCYEVPLKAIYMCKVGHHTCDKCRAKLTLCPTCQSPLTGSRNFLAEALVPKLEVLRSTVDPPQENQKPTTSRKSTEQTKCPQLPDNNNRLKHQSLPPGVYSCLLESCRDSRNGTYGKLYDHVIKKHSHIYDKFQNNSATFSHNFENFCLMKKKRKYHRCFHLSNMGLFFLSIEVLNDNYINCWLSMPVPISTANNFYCQFQFTKESNETIYSVINKVASNLHSEDWLLERGRVFVISPNEHKLQYNDFFSISVKVVYRPYGLKENLNCDVE